jgi:3-methyladenine DNA glycosylase AlkD
MANRVEELLKSTRARLTAAADPEFAAGMRQFFKEPVQPYGVRTPEVREFARLAYRELKQWLDRYVGNWSHCDGLSTWLIAASIANRPELMTKLARWTKSTNRWKRRAAAVSLIQEAKQGRNTQTIFRICRMLRGDTDDMVRKGVGWLFKK